MKSFMKQTMITLLAMIMIVGLVPEDVLAAKPDVTIQTTLVDGAVLKGSKKTFDVIARNSKGEKVASSVKMNGEAVAVNWDDAEKTSYTLEFKPEDEGENTVVISAGDADLTIKLTYQKANSGDVIGQAVIAVELFTLGCDYLIEPTYVDIIEGENAAQALVRLLEQNGYGYDYTGSIESEFYLSGIESGTSSLAHVEGNFPDYIEKALADTWITLDPDGREDEDWLGEFDYSSGSGWMYTLNNVFPNVGFSDSYLSDGDVVRTQFTLAYGGELGGGFFGSYLEVENRDALTALVAKSLKAGAAKTPELAEAVTNAKRVCATLNAKEADITEAYNKLNKAYTEAYNKIECPHKNTEWKVIEEATVDKEGKKQEVCLQCKSIVNEKTIAKLTASNKEPLKAPQTGDNSIFILYSMLLVVSFATVITVNYGKAKHK